MEVNLSNEHNNILAYFVIAQLFMQQSRKEQHELQKSFNKAQEIERQKQQQKDKDNDRGMEGMSL